MMTFPEHMENQSIPRTLYHGTNLKWWHMRNETNPRHYTNPNRGIVILTSDLRLAFDVATNRAASFKSKPIVLVIDSEVALEGGSNISLSSRNVASPDVEFDTDSIPKNAITHVYDMSGVRQSQLLFPEDSDRLPELGRLIE